MELTPEQQEILQEAKNLEIGNILVINALAGCGKTSTLLEIAKDNPDKRFLYLAFNKKVVQEAQKKFPENTRAYTLHGFARGYVGRKEIRYINNHLIANIVGIDISESKENFYKVNHIYDAYRNFCKSAIDLDNLEELKNEIRQELEERYKRKPVKNSKWVIKQRLEAVDYVPNIHKEILNSNFTTFDTFLKEFVTTAHKRVFNYDYIVLDEAQDISKLLSRFIISLVESGRYRIIIVGDNNQKIYGFLGNINLSKLLEDSYPDRVIKKQLTTSFRFELNSEMEILANKILNLRGEKIVGGGKDIQRDGRTAYLSRGTFPLLSMAIFQISNKDSYYLYGGVENFDTDEIGDIYKLLTYTIELSKTIPGFSSLSQEEKISRLQEHRGKIPFPQFRNSYLRNFSSFLELLEYVTAHGLSDIEDKINIALFIFKYRDEVIFNRENRGENIVIRFFNTIEKYSDENSPNILSTIHKSKGLQFENVVILRSLTVIYKDIDKISVNDGTSSNILGLTKTDRSIYGYTLDNSDFQKLSKYLKQYEKDEGNIFSFPENGEKPKLDISIRDRKPILSELVLNNSIQNIKEEYNILYVAVTRATHSIKISNSYYKASLEFLDFVNDNIEELKNILNGKYSPLLIRVGNRMGIEYKNSFISLETLKEFLPKI